MVRHIAAAVRRKTRIKGAARAGAIATEARSITVPREANTNAATARARDESLSPTHEDSEPVAISSTVIISDDIGLFSKTAYRPRISKDLRLVVYRSGR